MSQFEQADEEFDCEFTWGQKKSIGGKNRDVIFYNSCTYDGIEYFLFDSVYLYVENQPEPYIGKLVKMWESANHKKIIKAVWYFRAIEVLNYLKDAPDDNEIFLASGEGIGLFNINPLGVLVGKCNVVCTSKDERNPQPSKEEIRMADYIFHRTFDVGKLTLTDKLQDEIAGIDIRYYLNRKKALGENLNKKHKQSDLSPNLDLAQAVGFLAEDGKSRSIAAPGPNESKKNTVTVNEQKRHTVGSTISRPKNGFGKDGFKVNKVHISAGKISGSPLQKLKYRANVGPIKDFGGKAKKLPMEVKHVEKQEVLSAEAGLELAGENRIKTDDQAMEVTRKRDIDKSKWFKLTQKDILQNAYEKGTVVLFRNMDPSYSSAEIEDLVYEAFKEKCSVWLVPQTQFSSPYDGQALVIFKSKEVAETIIEKLNTGCLMLDGGRLLLAEKGTPRVLEKPAKFSGHLTIKQRLRSEMKNAVSTSHFPQPNTIEYDMAIEWCRLQKVADLWWETLHEEQGKKLVELERQLKPRN